MSLPALSASLTQRGPVLLTAQGLSGPCALRLSAFAARVLRQLHYKAELEVNWAAEMSVSDMLQHLVSSKARHPTR
jgi:predicted flavoprotein YhiN